MVYNAVSYRPLVLALFLTVGYFAAATANDTALDAYVAKADPSYGYELRETRHGVGFSVHALTMTSQEWRSPTEVDRVRWQHGLSIGVPWVWHSSRRDTALLIVDGGRNRGDLDTDRDELLGLLATVTGTVVALVSQVPNQPLTFADEQDSRVEDEILAYGMDKFLRTGDPEWLVHLAMTKAVVRAMDSVQSFAADPNTPWPEVPDVSQFVVLGGSKRGWTTWLTAAVEANKGSASRVRAIMPASIDLLNMDTQFEHHWEAYGFYSPQIQDYVDFDVPCRMSGPRARAMLEIIDPLSYRDRLSMPKLVLNSAGDQFFVPDSSQFYFHDLIGPTRLRYTLNTDHAQSLDVETIVLPTLAWLSGVLDDEAGPQFQWWLQADGSIRLQTYTEPKEVRLWQASNPDARDFRLETIGEAWSSTRLPASEEGVYVARVSPPERGWTAFTIEITFAGSTLLPAPLESDQVFTTDVVVVPDVLPFAGTACVCRQCLPSWSGWRSLLERR